MMGKDKSTPLIGIAALVLVIVFSASKSSGHINARHSTPAPALPIITSDVQFMTVDEMHAHLIHVLEDTMPGRYILDVDKNARMVTVDFWSPGFDATAVNMALHKREYLNKWHGQTSALAELCADLQDQFSNHGHPEYTVVYRLVNCDDSGQIFAVAERGVLTYDVVEDTPPGEEVPDPAARIAPSNTDSVLGTYIANIYSKVFHLPSCDYAEQISENRRAIYTGDRADLIAQGYKPCNWCDP